MKTILISVLIASLLACNLEGIEAGAIRAARSPVALADQDSEAVTAPSKAEADAKPGENPAEKQPTGGKSQSDDPLLNTLDTALGRLRSSPIADASLKSDIDQFQKAIRDGELDEVVEEVRKEVAVSNNNEGPNFGKVLESFSTRVPESFRNIIDRIVKAARGAFQRLLESGSKARTQIEDTFRSAFSSILDGLGR